MVQDRFTSNAADYEYYFHFVGLMTDYYDACIGWAPTIPRIQSFRFSKSYAVSMSAHFYLAGSPADASRQDFNVNDISRKKIGISKIKRIYVYIYI